MNERSEKAPKTKIWQTKFLKKTLDDDERAKRVKGKIVKMKERGFEIAKGFEDKNINLPIRKTKYSAGYDIEAAEDVTIPSFKRGMAPTLVKTGLKAYMQQKF